MAFAFAQVSDTDDVWGKTRVKQVTLKPAAADYATGGYALPPYMKKIQWVIPLGGQGVYTPQLAAGKVQMIVTSTGAEAAPAADLSALTFLLLIGGY